MEPPLSKVIDTLIFLCALTMCGFKVALYRMTRFWPFALFAVAFGLMVVIRGVYLFVDFATAQWVIAFWPLACIATVGLYFSMRRIYRRGINGSDGHDEPLDR
jgi:hypothetical protein